MPAVTILQSFSEPLPDGAREPGRESDRTHISGASSDADMPKVAFEVGAGLWVDLGERVLATGGHLIAECHLASWETTRIFRNEEDVVSAASPQLMNPVDLALTACHKTPIKVFNEFLVHGARPDKVWLAGSSPDRRPFAVLDYKRIGTVSKAELTLMFDAGRRAAQTGEFEEGLAGNEKLVTLLKIATNYATKFGTKYIAIFDWDSLLLLVMEDVQGVDGGDWCRATLVQDREKMRLALLGFLEGAYQSKWHNNNDHLRPHQRPKSSVPARPASERISRNPRHYYGSPPVEGRGGDDVQYTYHQPRGGNYESSSMPRQYGTGKERAYASTSADDFGLGRLTLDANRRADPRSRSRDPPADYPRSSRRDEAARQMNPFTPYSQRPGYESRVYDPRYQR